MISGSLLIDKKIGLTSRQEVNNVSHRLNEKKAGHIGYDYGDAAEVKEICGNGFSIMYL